MPCNTFANHTDYQLVNAFICGEDGAFTEIVHRYHRAMWWVARRYAHCDHDIHDILQEAFFRASQKLHNFREDCSLKTWLYRLVSNAGYDAYYRKQIPVDLTDDGELPEVGYDPMHVWELSFSVQRALFRLRPEQRVVLFLVDLLGHTVPQAAQLTGMPAGTVKSRRARARREMRELVAA
ncbi:sigma-70 family RNA polymerase sigma factor [Staphylococcus chromogenes]|nr:sigma-70 family RNA polymerase sigma factor [Staphylococcus chromogenes]